MVLVILIVWQFHLSLLAKIGNWFVTYKVIEYLEDSSSVGQINIFLKTICVKAKLCKTLFRLSEAAFFIYILFIQHLSNCKKKWDTPEPNLSEYCLH